MKRVIQCVFALVVMCFFCTCKKVVKVNFLELKSSSGEEISQVEFDAAGGNYGLVVNSGGKWIAKVEGQTEWYRLSSVSGGEGSADIELSVTENKGEARWTTVDFVSLENRMSVSLTIRQKGKKTEPEPEPEPEPGAIVADLLDVIFDEDGKAHDASPSKMQIEYVEGTSHMNYYSELYGRTVAHFNHMPGSVVSNGYYKVNYSGNPDFIGKLKDGHSLEVVFSTQEKLTGAKEVKMFCSHEGGGTGFLMTTSGWGNSLTFLPNVSTNSSSHWCWTKSGVNPEPGRYYHAVGVWDKKQEKAFIYVDGALKGTVDAKGDLRLPTSSSAHWFGIGADASPNSGQSAWYGDVVIARIYDQVLTAENVAELYAKVRVEQEGGDLISLKNIQYLASCTIPAGYKFHIYGQGFKAGDKVQFMPVSGEGTEVEIDGTAGKDELILEIPAGMQNGKYNMLLKRGTSVFPIGSVKMVIGSSETHVVKTQCVAHRTFHKNGIAENSLAGFIAAEKLGVWGSEIDVHLTKDNVVVVNHNATVPTDPKNRKIEEHTYAELSDIRLSNGEPLPKFEDFLKAMESEVANMNLVLEIKTQYTPGNNEKLVDKCVELIRNHGLEKRVAWIAFDYGICKRAAKAMPDNMVMYLGGNLTPKQCKADGIMGIDYSANVLKPEWIEEAHQLGMAVNVWTVNGSMEMVDFIGKEVDYITTDNPDVLKDLLSKDFITE